MSEKMGAANYNALVRKMMQLTLRVHEEHAIPCTGTFISYRGSMLNWAIPGRDCTLAQREDYHETSGTNSGDLWEVAQKNADSPARSVDICFSLCTRV